MTLKRNAQSLLSGALLAGLLTGLLPVPAHAWNSTGHMTVADIAYDALTPKTRAAVDALLARQRDYGLWVSQMPAGYTDRARYAFMKAATWPDDIRKTPDDRPTWHYIDIPIIAPGYTPDPNALLIVKPNAETQIAAETALLTTLTATDAERGVALCWIEHLVGDVHMPLHDAALFSPLFPTGDRGGNSESLAAGAVASDPLESQANPHKLHALWDDVLGNTQNPREIEKFAAGLEAPAFRRNTYPQIPAHPGLHEWIVEGSVLARQHVYNNLNLQFTPTGDGKAVVTLPNGYLPNMHVVGSRQIALAGLRLADLLNAQTFPPVTAPLTPLLPLPLPATAAPLPTADGQIIGNLRSHVYHLPGDTRLPAVNNRVYFKSEADAIAAGYHKPGGQ